MARIALQTVPAIATTLTTKLSAPQCMTSMAVRSRVAALKSAMSTRVPKANLTNSDVRYLNLLTAASQTSLVAEVRANLPFQF